MKNTTLTPSTKRMVKKYGEELCIKANKLYDNGVQGGRGVGEDLNVSTNTADALIRAGEEILNFKR